MQRRVVDTLRPERRKAWCRCSRSATVIGGGFIGLEAAEALRGLDLEVSVVEATDQLLAAEIEDRLDEGADVVRAFLERELAPGALRDRLMTRP